MRVAKESGNAINNCRHAIFNLDVPNLSNLVMFIQVDRIMKGGDYNPTELYTKFRRDKHRTDAEFDKIRQAALEHDATLFQFKQVR
jgi:hypothetical protein